MFNRKKDKNDPFINKYDNQDKFGTEFRAVINKTTSLTVYEPNKSSMIIVIKKELSEYELDCDASEAPEKNFIGGEALAWEIITADPEILIKEVFPINRAIQEVLGSIYNLRLNSIRLCIGNENDYVNIDETALANNNISPTIKGIEEFILSSRKGIRGFTVRHFDSKKGNLVLLESSLEQPNYEIKTIKVNIISSLQTRGFYMQTEHKPYGLHLYIVLKIRELSDIIVKLLEKLGIPIEMIYLKRTSAINKWQAVECELDENNLINYLSSSYNKLTKDDINNIVYFNKRNNLNFEIVDKMAEVLDKMKQEKEEKEEYSNESLNLEDIAAAAKIVLEHFGLMNKNIELPKGLNQDTILKSQDNLSKFI